LLLISLWDFKLSDVDGKTHSIADWKGKSAVVLFFLSTECPISNRYAPAINRLTQDFTAKNVVFYIVESDPALRPADAKKHASEFGLKMSVLMDPVQVLAARMA